MPLMEAPKPVPVQKNFDVLVCGGGPAGIASAIASARAGAVTGIVDFQGCLGGIWTAGLLSNILDAKEKPGLIAEIRRRLAARDAIAERFDLYDAEAMKLLLEEMCAEAGVEIRLHARLVSAVTRGRVIEHAVFEGKEGRFALGAKAFVDATGDGDLAAFAGCGFDLGREGDKGMQPMSLMAVVSNVPEEVMSGRMNPGKTSCLAKDEFYKQLVGQGVNCSYTKPSIFPLPNGLCALMINHEYGKSALDSRCLTEATLSARREIHKTIEAMRKFSSEWAKLQLVETAAHIGVREGRRIHGHYRVTVEDVIEGRRHSDAITRVGFPIDVHSVLAEEGGGFHGGNIQVQNHYDIPLRALIAKDCENLAMAGRCISGDFLAHASYRVTGNSVTTGEAAGVLAAFASCFGLSLREVKVDEVLSALEDLRNESCRFENIIYSRPGARHATAEKALCA